MNTPRTETVLSLVTNAAKVVPEAGPRPDGITAFDPCSHVANAQRIRKHFGERLLYVNGIGWHVWGPPWRHDELAAQKLVHGLGAIIAQEAADLAAWAASAPNSNDRKEREHAMEARFRWARQTEQEVNLQASLHEARAYLYCDAADLDTNPLMLGFPNGVLNLDSGTFRDHEPGDRISKIMGCAYNPDARAPTWETFLSDVFDDDDDLFGWVQRFLGYCLSGKREEHLLPICWGAGGNGKGTLLETLLAMFGDYGGMAPPGLLMEQHNAQHPT